MSPWCTFALQQEASEKSPLRSQTYVNTIVEKWACYLNTLKMKIKCFLSMKSVRILSNTHYERQGLFGGLKDTTYTWC